MTEDQNQVGDSGVAGGEPTPRAPLFLVRGDATDEEVAAITVVLHALAASRPADGPGISEEWSAHRRKVRSAHLAGPSSWRSSALPR